MVIETTSVIPAPRAVRSKRNLKKVPYVEMVGNKLQGVVSSGSDIQRVYVSWIEAATGDCYCSTNNNRRCGGLRGHSCKHIDAMVSNAIEQFGGDQVARFLGIEGEAGAFQTPRSILGALRGSIRNESAGDVFARFLNYLRYMDLAPPREAMVEMTFFLTE